MDTRISESRILDVVDHIYEAAGDPEGWQTAIDALSSLYPDGRATLLHHDLDQGSGTFSVTDSAWDRNWIDAYNQHYARQNPWLKNLKKRPIGLAVPAEFMLERSALTRTAFYHEYLRPQNMMTGIGVTIEQTMNRFVAVSALLPESAAENERENVAALQRLAPHFRRTLQLNRTVLRGKLSGHLAESVLDRLSAAFMLADIDARILYCNAAAERILRANDGLALDGSGTMTTHYPAMTTQLKRLVHGAIRVLDMTGVSPGGTLKIGRPSNKRAYSVLVSPVRLRHSPIAPLGAAAAIVISDPDQRPCLPATELASIFGITKAEARLLGLLIEGKPVEEASTVLGISPMTGRGHLKSIFSKLGCSRQSDLLQRVLDHPVWLINR